jgi:endo-1,4-beta-xylanase
VKRNHSLLLLLLPILLVGCAPNFGGSIKTVTATPKATHSAQPTPMIATTNVAETLRAQAQARGILIGAAVNVDALEQESEYAQVLSREFNLVTPENVMKLDTLEPSPGVYNFKQADELVAFAKAHQMQVHGHNFVWGQALPDWLQHGSFTKAQLSSILHDYIATVMARYKGQVTMWDVVNEALGDPKGYHSSIWYDTLGSDGFDMAFRWAHEADPQVQLFYNDYGVEALGAKSDAMYAMVKGMLARGVPINGVGLQMHISLDGAPSEQSVIANMQRFAALGLKVQISEMDVQLQGDPRPLPQKLQAQAEVYKNMLSACLAVSACESFTMWGFTDRHTWIPYATGHPDQPLIFDNNYQRKPAYTALLQTLQQR